MKNFFAKFFALFLILQIATPGVIASTVESVWMDELYYENEIIIQYDENQVNIQNEKTLSSIENNIKNNNSEVKEAILEENIVVVERKNNPLENVLDAINGTSKEKKMEKIINLYKEDPAVIHAQPNFKYKIHSTPKFNDPLYAEQWYLENIGTPITGMGKIYEANGKPGRESIASTNDLDIDYEEAFSIYEIARERLSEEKKNKKIRVAVIDTGVDYSLKEFEWKMWDGSECKSWTGAELGWCQHGYNFGWEIPDGDAILETHGTQVASLIAANSNNREGMVGIAPNTEIIALNVKWLIGISSVGIIKAISFAEANNADIINISIGSAEPINLNNIPLVDKLTYGIMKDFSGIIVNSAGNEGTHIDNDESVVFPAGFARSFEVNGERYDALENLIVVGSENSEWNLSDFSNYGKNTVHIIAPGSDILVTGRGGMNERLEGTDYDMNSGTSFASPIVAGSIAFLMSAYPNKTPLEIKEILLSSAEKTEIHTENSMEWRRLNLANAMKLAEKRIDLESELSGNIIADNSKWTNNNVKLTIESNKDILDIDTWKKISQKKFEKIFENNQNINITIQTKNWQQKNLNYNLQNIDKTAPKLAITSPKNEEKISNNSVQISFNTEDRESWIQEIECRKNSEAWKKCDNNHSLEIPQEWEYHIQARAVDIAWNISEISSVKISKISGNSSGNSNQITNQPSISTISNRQQSSSGGGWYVYTENTPITETNIDNNTSEESITFSSASDSSKDYTLPFLYDENSLFREYEQNLSDLNLLELNTILSKKWIQKEKNWGIYNFSIGEKFIFFEKILNSIQETPESQKTTKTLLQNNNISPLQNLYNNLMEEWKSGKFFILK